MGSAYYHLAPDDASLAWDRLPIAVAFMCLLCAVITERLRVAPGWTLLAALALVGAASVVYWRAFDDLRPYALAQFGSFAAIVFLCAWFPSQYRQGWVILGVAALYGVAKVCELYDRKIYELTGHSVSGHTLNSMDQLVNIVNAAKPGDTLNVTIRRGASTHTVTVTLGDRPNSVSSSGESGIGR